MPHTQGPWDIRDDSHYSESTPLTIVCNDGRNGVAGVAGHGDPLDENSGATEETWANARLIASAPDLLRELRALSHMAGVLNNRRNAGLEITPVMWEHLQRVAARADELVAKIERTK